MGWGTLARACLLTLAWAGSVAAHGDCGEAMAGEGQLAAHDAITTDLFHGNIVHAVPFHANGNQHQIFRVRVHNPKTGRTRNAFFKPRQHGDADGWGRTPMEYVAYRINRLLGMDYIPPVAYRRWLHVDGQFFFEGALSFAVPDAHLLLDVRPREWGISEPALRSDNRVLNVLLQNPDSIHNNLLRGKHWTDGRYRPFFLDFSASLHPGLSVTMTYYPYYRNSDLVYRVRRRTLAALRALHWNHLRELSEFISEDEMRGILHRRDGIVAYFDGLVRERGEREIILDE